MNTVSSLSSTELAARLAAGLHLRTGNFTTRLQTAIPSVARGIGLLYADYAIEGPASFADFHLELARPRNPRRWIRPQVQLLYDGRALFKPLPLDQAFPMFEWGLNWCISSRAHRYLIVHAAVVEKHGRAAILPAPPGSGKSTLCAALVGRGGWRLLSDELTLLRLDDGQLAPVPRPISLKNQSIELIRGYLGDAVLSDPVSDTTKGTVAHMKAPRESIEQSHCGATPAWVVFPQYAAGAEPVATPMAPAHTFMQLADNTFNYSLLGVQGFDALARLIDASAGYQFRYSRLDDGLAFFDRLAAGQQP
ncbi:HprK-related kinase A [Rugamonas sp.]|uniref:HprK-related kinase A n=1 Tax=Rugamonas sp. TaxID=1926287 RepID=UPI0025E4CF41|nr:HprK-related kinase A [Rugamonas sp.]